MKTDRKVKILGNDNSLKENILNFVSFMKYSNAIDSFDECQLCYGDSCEEEAKKINEYLIEHKISLNIRKTKRENIALKFKAYDLTALCHKMPEPEEFTNIHAWSALFNDGKIVIDRVE